MDVSQFEFEPFACTVSANVAPGITREKMLRDMQGPATSPTSGAGVVASREEDEGGEGAGPENEVGDDMPSGWESGNMRSGVPAYDGSDEEGESDEK